MNSHINAMKMYCETFGIPEEISSDGGPQFTGVETQNSLEIEEFSTYSRRLLIHIATVELN